jgi:hypothetical protein
LGKLGNKFGDISKLNGLSFKAKKKYFVGLENIEETFSEPNEELTKQWGHRKGAGPFYHGC